MRLMPAATFHSSYGLMLRGLQIMEIFMITTAALLAGVLLLLITSCPGLHTDRRLSHKAHQSQSGMRQLTQQKKLRFLKIYFMNFRLIAHAKCLCGVTINQLLSSHWTKWTNVVAAILVWKHIFYVNSAMLGICLCLTFLVHHKKVIYSLSVWRQHSMNRWDVR